ncbi:hypothetical protein [Haladaptatus pallidirubidus]|uniref:hypothetical protein n=1 Tax=Haladaptatus pallidirubidus TaxID=1008152 RepID=UPI0036F229B4
MIDGNENRVHSVNDFLEQDAVDTALQVEQLLVENLPQLVEETRTTDVNAEQRHLPPATAVAVTVMAILSNGEGIDPAFERILLNWPPTCLPCKVRMQTDLQIRDSSVLFRRSYEISEKRILTSRHLARS